MKIVIEFDTDIPAWTLTKDGKDFDPRSIDVGCFSFSDGDKYYYLTIGEESESGVNSSQSFTFDSDKTKVESNSDMQIEHSKSLQTAHRTLIRANKLSEVLNKK